MDFIDDANLRSPTREEIQRMAKQKQRDYEARIVPRMRAVREYYTHQLGFGIVK